jgi:hypothetical protein
MSNRLNVFTQKLLDFSMNNVKTSKIDVNASLTVLKSHYEEISMNKKQLHQQYQENHELPRKTRIKRYNDHIAAKLVKRKQLLAKKCTVHDYINMHPPAQNANDSISKQIYTMFA